MPFYEYECASCKFYTEVMQKISDAPLEKCPSCGKKALKKLVSAPVFRLKGGGWYETDFKSDKEGKRNIADREEPSAPKSEDTKSADSKPAASVESTGKSASGSTEGAAKVSATESGGGSSRVSSRAKTAGARSAASRSKPPAKAASKSSSKARAKSQARKKGRR
jgi:putative FmdB family regulatory protein